MPASRNKKVRNACPTLYDDIQFKSKSEVAVYKLLVSEGLKPDYEKRTFLLWKGYKPNVPFYNRTSKGFKLDSTKLRDVTYTPDFTFKYNNLLVIIEVKGKENDVFPLKKKMFRKTLETLEESCIYFEVRSLKETREAITIIRNYHEETK